MLRALIRVFAIFSSYQLLTIVSGQDEKNKVNSTLVTYWCDENILPDVGKHMVNQRSSIELLSKKIDDLYTLLQKQTEELNNSRITSHSIKLTSCDEALNNSSNKDGVYLLDLSNQFIIKPFFVNCIKDSETNKPWTIIQRRINGNIDFYRNWLEYEIGFGDLYGSYWLGLEKIHLLTNSKPHKLWIELRDFDGNTRNAYYNLFAIGDANTKYALNVLGEFTGNAGDSLRYHAGHKFSTKDDRNKFNDGYTCATVRRGAWWFNNCQDCHLNGEYLNGTTLRFIDHGMGINWYTWHGSRYSLKYVHMAIRPVD